MNTKDQLLHHLKEETKVLESEELSRAFEKIDRADFVGEDYLPEAYEDYPLPIGYGQMISQPTTVAFMLGMLDPKPGEKVLDVGSGSGWTTALLSTLVEPDGEVLGVEIIPELAVFGSENLQRYNFPHTAIIPASKTGLGYPSQAPYDKILVSAAAATDIPDALLSQLSPGGTMVMPVHDDIVKIKKHAEKNSYTAKRYPGFSFVPLIEGK
jgi:protein-L-isoaspartate(D-aspartate) O-methyltransferase